MARVFHSPKLSLLFSYGAWLFIPPFPSPYLSFITLSTSSKWDLKYLSFCNRLRFNVVWIHPFCSVVRITSLFKADTSHCLCHIWLIISLSWTSRLLLSFSYSDSVAINKIRRYNCLSPCFWFFGVYTQKWNFARTAILWNFESLANL